MGLADASSRLHQWVRSRQVDLIALACGGLFEGDDFRVHVVRHRHGEKQEDQREADGAPFLELTAFGSTPLITPLGAPDTQEAYSDQQPEKIEKQFHRHGCH